MNMPTHFLCRRVLLPGLALAACFLAAARPAHAQTDFTFTVSNPNIVAAPGSTVALNGTVTFTGPSSNRGFAFGLYSPGLVSAQLDPSFDAFFFNSALPTYTGALLDLTFFSSDPAGSVASFPNTVISVSDSSGAISRPVTLTVAPAAVPEPAPALTFAVAALGLGGLMLVAARRRQASAAAAA